MGFRRDFVNAAKLLEEFFFCAQFCDVDGVDLTSCSVGCEESAARVGTA